MENKLRTAQCHDALDNVRHILCIKARMVEFKNKHVRGQRDGTRSRSVIDRLHARACVAAEKYRAARIAKLALVGGGDWEATLQILKDSDLRAYSDPSRLKTKRGRLGTVEDDALEGLAAIGSEDQRDGREQQEDGEQGLNLFPEVRTQREGTGETRRMLSWIWITTPIELADGQNDDLLQSEWAKSRARAARATEEILLLREEMRRVLEFLQWKADWWLQRTDSRTTVDASLSEGLQAYCKEQSYVQSLLSISFRALWRTPLQDGEDEGAEGDEHNDDDDPDNDDDPDGDDTDGGTGGREVMGGAVDSDDEEE